MIKSFFLITQKFKTTIQKKLLCDQRSILHIIITVEIKLQNLLNDTTTGLFSDEVKKN